jgi:CheY-like chemotaxis protein
MKPEKVLVADDDEMVLRLMASYLERSGYEVGCANDGYDALGKLQMNGPFAVLVTDLSMPGMSGLELLRSARKLDPQLEVIVISAAGSLESAVAAMREGGAYNYLLKPFEMLSELSLAVERAAEHRRLHLERETLRDALRFEADHLQAILANTGEAILSADGQGYLRVANERAARLLGQDNLVGSEARSSLPPPLATLLANWQAVGGHSPALMEIPWSAEATRLVRLTPLQDEKGKAQGWMMVVGDTAPFKRQVEIKMQFLQKVANKIHLPLTQLMFALAELKDELKGKEDRSTDLYYRLGQFGSRIQEGMEELLSEIQVESSAVPRLTPVDLPTLVTEMLKSLPERLTRNKSFTLKVNLTENLPPVRANPELLRRLLEGLLQRAAARNEPGGPVQLSTSIYRDQVWIKIRDEGPALPEADLPHIFEPSFARPETTALGGETAGLELALAKRLVDQMEGQLWLGGEGWLGSSLLISLPVMPTSPALLARMENIPARGHHPQPEVSPPMAV